MVFWNLSSGTEIERIWYLIDWLLFIPFEVISFHLHRDVIIADEGLQYVGLCSALEALKQGGNFIVSHLLWHGTSVYKVSSEGPPSLFEGDEIIVRLYILEQVLVLQVESSPHIKREALHFPSSILVLTLHIYIYMGIYQSVDLLQRLGMIFQADSNIMILVKDNYF